MRKNSVTGRDFTWLELATYGASYDAVVASPDAADSLPEEGAVVQGAFWLIAAVASS